MTTPFRFNAYYEEWQVRETPADWQLELSGLIADKTPWTIDKLRALPQEAQVTRHICIEGWSQIGQWSGVPLHVFLRGSARTSRPAMSPSNASTAIRRVSICPARCTRRPSWRSISMGKPLAPEWGAPVRLRIPTKLGFKSAKNLEAISVTNTYPGGYWEDQGYNWFSGS